MILQIRTKDNLDELLRHGNSPSWVISEWRVNQIKTVEIYQFDGKKVLIADFDASHSSRTDNGRLIVAFKNGTIKECEHKWIGQNPVKYISGNDTLSVGKENINSNSDVNPGVTLESIINNTRKWFFTDESMVDTAEKQNIVFTICSEEINNCWIDIEDILNDEDKSVDDKIRNVGEILYRRLNLLPLNHFTVDGTYSSSEKIDWDNEDLLFHSVNNDINSKIWQYFSDLISTFNQHILLINVFFPVGYTFYQSKEKVNELYSKVSEFIDEGVSAEDIMGSILREEYYSLDEELPEVYDNLIGVFIDKATPDQIGEAFMDHSDRLSAMSEERFNEMREKFENQASPDCKKEYLSEIESFHDDHF